MNKNQVSEQDIEYLSLLRENVEKFMSDIAHKYVKEGDLILDIAPQDHKGAKPFFNSKAKIETLDIDPNSKATYICDLCDCADKIGLSKYDHVVCTEVLEHTLQPFFAVNNIYKMLKKGGCAFVTTPFNFRIHGPLPDCWRFSEHGLRELFKDFSNLEIAALETNNRFLMPIQYTLIAQK